MGLTDLQRKFAEAYTLGPTAGNATGSVRAAGYAVASDNSAGSLGSQLLKDPEVKAEIIRLRMLVTAKAAAHAVPWQRLVPAAQALQMEAVEAARATLAQLKGSDDAPIQLERVNGPLVGLIKAGLEAAETIEAYGIGKPITRTETGAPGEFEQHDLSRTIAEVRDTLALLQAAGIELTPTLTAALPGVPAEGAEGELAVG